MNEISNDKLLAEMRILAAKARGNVEAMNNGEKVTQEFAGVLKDALGDVSALQKDAADKKERFTMGDPSVNLVDTMVASQKAGLAFEATLQVRNKLVQAYQDIMNMPI